MLCSCAMTPSMQSSFNSCQILGSLQLNRTEHLSNSKIAIRQAEGEGGSAKRYDKPRGSASLVKSFTAIRKSIKQASRRRWRWSGAMPVRVTATIPLLDCCLE
ncbi:hypothetical protein BS78_10G259700 [Paspalum vaginatum]|nr:hypothetical protein BS78_10G259700 [Paspalum vaginatum]